MPGIVKFADGHGLHLPGVRPPLRRGGAPGLGGGGGPNLLVAPVSSPEGSAEFYVPRGRGPNGYLDKTIQVHSGARLAWGTRADRPDCENKAEPEIQIV